MGISRRSNSFSLAAIVALLGIGIGAPASFAVAQQVFTVTRGDDPIPSETGSLRWAVEQANATPGTDVVSIDGQSIGFVDRDDFVREAVIELSDRIDITESLRITRQSGSLSDRIRVVGSGASRVLSFTPDGQDEDAALELWNLDISNGRTQAPANPDSCGPDSGQGGAICALGDVHLQLSTVADSSTSGSGASGGAIWASGVIRLLGSRISDNATDGDDARGGGVSASQVTCLQSVVHNNRTEGDTAPGGGIHAWNRTFGRLCRVSANRTFGQSAHGGGIATGDLESFGDLGGFNISDNAASGPGARGGGAFVNWLNVSQSTFSSNQAASAADAIYVQSAGLRESYSIAASTIVTRHATPIVLDSVTAQVPAGFSLQILNSALVVNSDEAFPTVFVPGVEREQSEAQPIELVQGGNFPADWSGDLFTGRILSDLESAGFCWLGLGEFLGSTAIGGECMAGHEPLPQSPLVDEGNASLLAADAVWDGRDRGFDRVVGGAPDIGAVESTRVIAYFTAGNPDDTFRLGDSFLAEFLIAAGAECSRSGLPGTDWNTEQFIASGEPELLSIDTSGLDLEQLDLTPGDLEDEPGIAVGLSCDRGVGDGGSIQESRIRDVTILPAEDAPLEPVLEVEPDTVVQGNPVTISWDAGSESDAVCAGSGLPGWTGGDKAAAGSVTIATAQVAPGDYSVGLECSNDGGTASVERALTVLSPTSLSLEGAPISGPADFGSLVRLDVENTGDAPAQSIALAIDAPAGVEIDAILRLAPQCEVVATSEPAAVRCDVDAIPEWECTSASGQAQCLLEGLPPGGSAGVVLEMSDSGGDLAVIAGADNAQPVNRSVPVGE